MPAFVRLAGRFTVAPWLSVSVPVLRRSDVCGPESSGIDPLPLMVRVAALFSIPKNVGNVITAPSATTQLPPLMFRSDESCVASSIAERARARLDRAAVVEVALDRGDEVPPVRRTVPLLRKLLLAVENSPLLPARFQVPALTTLLL